MPRKPLPDNFFSVYERLYSERIIDLPNYVPNSRELMRIIVPGLLELYDSKSKDPIRVLINSPALGAQESLVLSNILKCSPVPVHTTLISPVVRLGPAFILAGGTQGKRAALPNSKISFGGAFVDLSVLFSQNHELICKNIRDKRELVKKLVSVCAKSTSYSEYELLSTIESGAILSPADAINFGIIDHVVNVREENEKRIVETFNPF